MLSVKQIELNAKRNNDKIAKLTKELAGLKENKIKLASELKKAKEAAPKKGKSKR